MLANEVVQKIGLVNFGILVVYNIRFWVKINEYESEWIFSNENIIYEVLICKNTYLKSQYLVFLHLTYLYDKYDIKSFAISNDKVFQKIDLHAKNGQLFTFYRFMREKVENRALYKRGGPGPRRLYRELFLNFFFPNL